MAVPAGKILIVDDEPNIRKGLRAILVRDGHDVHDVGTGEEAVEVLKTLAIEVAIVDIRMPGMSGTDLLAAIRTRWPHLAVLLLTGHGTLETAITAVKQGAHDYLLKPAQPDEIRAVVNQALTAARRRREEDQLLDTMRGALQRLDGLSGRPEQAPTTPAPDTPHEQDELTIGNLRIDLAAHEVMRGDAPLSLTPTEYKLLLVLARRKGEAIDYVTLAQLVLEYEAELWEAKELIKRHVFTLRQKIEPDPSQPGYVVNVRGVGYRLDDPKQ
ncbi:MAG: response regulator transcription factor [Chloroflexota bacterium]